VAILLVVVVAGDLFISTQLAAPGEQFEIATLSDEASATAVAIAEESDTAREAPEAQAFPEEETQVKPLEEAPRMLAPPTPVGKTVEGSEAAQPLNAMGEGGPITDTARDLPLTIEGMPEKTPPGAPPESDALPQETPLGLQAEPSHKQQVPDDTIVSPMEDKQDPQQSEATPLTMAPPAVGQGIDQPDVPATAEPSQPGIRSVLPVMLARVGWRIAEIGLGILMIGLIIALVWVHRQD
jgi:hypothetical protein